MFKRPRAMFAIMSLVFMLSAFVICGCVNTGTTGENLRDNGKQVQDIGKVVPPPAGSWIEWAGAALAGLGAVVIAQEKRVRNEKKKVKDLENKGA